MNVINKETWIWCEFSSIDTNYLTKIQDRVQNKLIGPKFKIHLTLAGPFQNIDNSSVEGIKKYCNQNSPLVVNTHCYGYKEKFFQSLFISIDKSKELEDLRKEMFKINCQNQTEKFFPHISLLYGNFQKKIKENLISSLPRLKKNLTINKISLVEINEDINLWEISKSFSFNSALSVEII